MIQSSAPIACNNEIVVATIKSQLGDLFWEFAVLKGQLAAALTETEIQRTRANTLQDELNKRVAHVT